MKSIIISLFILFVFSAQGLAATVGSPEITLPDQSSYFKKDAIDKEFNRYEYNINVKASLDIEIVTERKLESADADTPSAELEGQTYMLKFSNNFYNLVEPYIKIGSSNLDLKWDQYGRSVKVETGPGFVWGVGAKVKLYEFEDMGIKLTLDGQYRDTELDIDKIKLAGAVPSTKDENFEIDEWQVSLLGSKKFILPFGNTDYYLVSYGGITYSSSTVDVKFTDSIGILYSTFDANDRNEFGIVLGCDIMPFYTSCYLLNVELRLINETALSLGGTVKF